MKGKPMFQCSNGELARPLIVLSYLLLQSLVPSLAIADGTLAPMGAAQTPWMTIDNATLTRDGEWFIYRTKPADSSYGEDSTVIVRSVHGDVERSYKGGPAERGGGEFEVAPSGHWLAVFMTATPSETSIADAAERSTRKLALIELATGHEMQFQDVDRFEFAGGGGVWVGLQSRSAGTQASRDLKLVNLRTVHAELVKDVDQFAFNKPGTQLAWSDAEGLHLRDLAKGRTHLLDTGAQYEKLTWSARGGGLAAIRAQCTGVHTHGGACPRVLVAFTHCDRRTPSKTVLDPNELNDFPAGYEISADEVPPRTPYDTSAEQPGARKALVWRDDESGLFFGIRPAEHSDAVVDERNTASRNPMLWHWRGAHLPTDKGRAQVDDTYSYLSYVTLANKHWVRLADRDLRDVEPRSSGSYVLGYDDTAYDLEYNVTGHRYRDYYAINLATGQRTLFARRLLLPSAYFQHMGPDPQIAPDGTTVLYLDDGQYIALDLSTAQRHALTGPIPHEFYRKDSIYSAVPDDKDCYPLVQGWTQDGKYVLVWDRYDVWALPLKGGRSVNLTVNGRRGGIRYVRTVFGARDESYSLFPYQGNNRFVDLKQPLYFRTIDVQTRATGLARVVPGHAVPEMLHWENARVRYQKAAEADVYVGTVETAVMFPDYYLVNASWDPTKRITDVNPQQRRVTWSPGARLLSYAAPDGERLQGVLHLPAGYQEGKSYPTIVSIYERQSQDLYDYRYPTVNGGTSITEDIPRWTQHGYAVFLPDIQPLRGQPGRAAVQDVVAGVAALIATGVAEPGRLGLEGHSYGGYETNFIVTQTNIFKAAISKDGFADLWSSFGAVYSTRQPTVQEVGQPYMRGPWWLNWDDYLYNSPLFHARNIQTPLLLVHGSQDDAVSVSQSIELFQTLRAIGGKQVVLLEYRGEEHVFKKHQDLVDLTKRQTEFFDHFLKDGPAPSWWANGS